MKFAFLTMFMVSIGLGHDYGKIPIRQIVKASKLSILEGAWKNAEKTNEQTFPEFVFKGNKVQFVFDQSGKNAMVYTGTYTITKLEKNDTFFELVPGKDTYILAMKFDRSSGKDEKDKFHAISYRVTLDAKGIYLEGDGGTLYSRVPAPETKPRLGYFRPGLTDNFIENPLHEITAP